MARPDVHDPQPQAEEVPPYQALAAGYDRVMAHVDYDQWAHFAHRLLQAHHPAARDLLELGCGTGSLALRLQPLGGYDYQATDASPAMLRVARAKARAAGVPLHFAQVDFTHFEAAEPADAVLLLYDGLNYLLAEEPIRVLFQNVRRALRPGGVFLFDQSTPANSYDAPATFDDEGAIEGFAYVRRSRYDPRRRLHTTTFELEVEGRRFFERHVQRAYTLDAVRRLLRAARLEEVATYDGFSSRPAGASTKRIHWVVRKEGA